MPFTNRVRLPLQLHSAQFPEARNVYRKANGATVTLSVVTRKTYQLETDFLPERIHERLKVALAHDNVTIEGERYVGLISQDGDYTIDWPEGVHHFPFAKASSVVQVTPFNATNSNCQTCEEATNLDLEDDDMEGDLEENTEYQAVVSINDSVCCSPAVWSITTYNPTYIVAIAISQSGTITFTMGTGLTEATVLLATYRVTCPNGNYDEANLYGNVAGTVVGCFAPSGIDGEVGPTTADLTWLPPEGGTPPNGYIWEIWQASPLVLVDSGITATESVNITGLLENTQYLFFVRSDCGGGNESTNDNSNFTTAISSDACGLYDVNWSDGTPSPGEFSNVTYIDCNGNPQTIPVFNGVGRPVCALQTSPGNPVSIVGATEINYIGLCT